MQEILRYEMIDISECGAYIGCAPVSVVAMLELPDTLQVFHR